MNIHVSRVDCTECVSYLSSLDNFGLTQLMNLPTRKNAKLDHIITNILESLENIGMVDCHYSDHDFTSFTVAVEVSRACPKYVSYREFRNFSFSSFSEELAWSSLDNILFLRNIDDKVTYLSEVLTRLFNKHVPMRVRFETKRNDIFLLR
ncbi:hypothetical protein WA026_012363 [Henosepilachna vigintioctopunctata]|uniref:Uncharacterized protein n=1 Tax=Henosepilachna vigintioctopunctata TaxID=420089 RepID=A0AAW1V0F5_9CUCU